MLTGPSTSLLDLSVRLVLPAARAELLELETLCGRLLVLGVGVVPLLALLALEGNDFARHLLLSFLFTAGLTFERPILGKEDRAQ